MKNRVFVPALLVALLLPALQACAPMVIGSAAVGAMSIHDRRTTGVQTDDETTEWKARAAVPEAYRSTSRLSFTAYNRQVLITGEVPDAGVAAQIEREVRRIDGVRGVFNELRVGPLATLSDRGNDAFVDSKVKARLVDSRAVSANHIKVVTDRGVTYLMGLVNEREAQEAVRVARTTAGVRKVVNVMEVVSESETQRLDARNRARSTEPAPVENR